MILAPILEQRDVAVIRHMGEFVGEGGVSGRVDFGDGPDIDGDTGQRQGSYVAADTSAEAEQPQRIGGRGLLR
jgi:hypothetical protein